MIEEAIIKAMLIIGLSTVLMFIGAMIAPTIERTLFNRRVIKKDRTIKFLLLAPLILICIPIIVLVLLYMITRDIIEEE